ncbi:MAG: TIGR02206 family membrane protein [Verrucomicrobiota bacterium]
MPTSAFHAFGPSHLAVLGICLGLLLLLTGLRRLKPEVAVWAERALALVLLTHWPLVALNHWLQGTSEWGNSLPLHLCDVAGISGGIALLTRNRLAAEIVYFFGLAGTLQGLITPNLDQDYPAFRFYAFFVLHGGVVVAALHVVTSLGCPPREGSVPRMVGLTLLYALVVGLVNAVTKANFAFLCEKPAQASLMNVLGPWPWYIGSLVLLCAVFYSVLYAPFFVARQLRARKTA